MKAFAIAAFLLFVSAFIYGQNNMIAWNEAKRLRWKDFSGKVKDTSYFDAETFAEIKYTYKFNSFSDFEFDVKANFDKQTSWIKKENRCDALLKHEQVHFDIAQLYAIKLKQAFCNFSYSANFKYEILYIFDHAKDEYHKMQQLYDDDTNHSTITVKQKQWEVFIKSELDRLKQTNFTQKRKVNSAVVCN